MELNKIKKVLSEKNISNKKFAKDCDLSESYVSMFLSGKIPNPSHDTVSTIERVVKRYQLNYDNSFIVFADDEVELLVNYRFLSDKQKKTVLDVMDCMIESSEHTK